MAIRENSFGRILLTWTLWVSLGFISANNGFGQSTVEVPDTRRQVPPREVLPPQSPLQNPQQSTQRNPLKPAPPQHQSAALGQVSSSSATQFFAIVGEPFGVASISLPIGIVEQGRLPRIVVSDKEGRIFYPAVDLEPIQIRADGTVVGGEPFANQNRPERQIGRGGLVDRLRKVIRQNQDVLDPPRVLRIQFLFVGDKPLEIHLSGDLVADPVVTPTPFDPGRHRAWMMQWWDGYTQQAKRQLEASDYPPGIETYLSDMLASRLNLPLADLRSKREIATAERDVPLSTLELLGGVESLRNQVLRAALSPPKSIPGGPNGNVASVPLTSVPLPPPPLWTEPIVPEVPPDLPIEKIASHVPPECFYLRFERFANYLWFQQLTEAQGRGISQMIMMRGVDFKTDQRVERMLNTKTSVASKLFGNAIIQDIALIGLDLYVQDGPALGVLFESTSADLLQQSLDSERAATAEQLKETGVQLENIEILGVPVTFLSSPDNRIRSFRVRTGDYILVTTCRKLCERFLEVSQGSPSMAANKSFRYARLSLPVQNEYSLFAFFSPQFFRSLVSPQYTIELRRRIHAIAHLQLAEMASIVDAHETQAGVKTKGTATNKLPKPANSPSRDIPSLIAKELLPPWFLQVTPDSQPIFAPSQTPNNLDSGSWIDSTRGARGSFLPIPDVKLNECTQEESASYVEQSSYYVSHWQQTDPLAFGVRRFSHPTSDSIERLAIEAYVAPFGRDKYGWLSQQLAPPVKAQIRLPSDDMVNLQIHMSGQTLFGLAPVPDHVLFAGIKDMIPPPPNSKLKLLEALRTLQLTPAYLGAWPLPGYLDRLPLGFGGGAADAFGFSRLIIGAWRWQGNGFSVLSFDRSILENSIPTLQAIPAKDPAQARGMVADLENSKLSSWINTYWYRRGLQASRGNARLLDTIQTQFQIPPIEAKDVAERLIDGVIQCPLGGQYAMTSTKDNSVQNALWSSSAWPAAATKPAIVSSGNDPAAYQRSYSAGIEMNPDKAFPPPEYRAPWLGWFRGGQVHLTQLSSQLILIGQIDLEKLPPKALPKTEATPVTPLPKMNFDLFTLPFGIFGNGTDSSETDSSDGGKDQKDNSKSKPEKEAKTREF